MAIESFSSIIGKLRNNQITPDRAKQLLSTLKGERRNSFHKVKSQAPFPATDDRSNPLKFSEIAVIGISGQFPGAPNVEIFWENLKKGRDGVYELPPRYLDQRKDFHHTKQPGKSYCKWGGVLEERDCFDPLFFNISPREAESMNPHQRLILQESWKGLEDAGYNPKSLTDSQTGIFIGAEPTGYFHETFIGSSEAIIASRLSYYLDFKGPALVVNTACSSSAVAIHLACESLRNRESSLALAGGVAAVMDAKGLIALSQIEMLSPTGRCATFDTSGDGTVFSEGVGIVVLKRLQEAIIDGDRIYGIIQGSGVNQDGASNGITAPNGVAQEALITDVYRRYDINPEEISYVEAHGTGTQLGDPVEANALVRAFKQFTDKRHFCALGSAKAHIGHTGATAGVIGLIKILLSLQHHKIPGLLHFNELNPLIGFEDSAFYINSQTAKWHSGNSQPLLAALNSFGHSGTNAHLVVREYIPTRQENEGCPARVDVPVLVPLSAKTEGQLLEIIKNLHSHLETPIKNHKRVGQSHLGGGGSEFINLNDLAYTLQVGREAMQERVIFLVKTLAELSDRLYGVIRGDKRIEDCWNGQVKQSKKEKHLLARDEDTEELVAKWMAKGKLKKVAELWSDGLALDWSLLYGEVKPHRVSLPTYPFAKQHYWGPEANSAPIHQPETSSGRSCLHPLVHQNTSDLVQQGYSSTFEGKEFFLEEHVIKGKKILPGVAYLEMARAAVEQAGGRLRDSQAVIQLRNIVWTRPIIVHDQVKQVYTSLFVHENGQIQYEICSEPEPVDDESSEKADGELLLHSQGVATFHLSDRVAHMDLGDLLAKINENHFGSKQYYDVYKASGLELGPAFQGLKEIYIGQDQVIAKLGIPPSVEESLDHFVLHPSLLDSALQASIGLTTGLADVLSFDHSLSDSGMRSLLKPSLPFALEELEVIGKCTANMWAWIRRSESSAVGDKVQKLDIDLGDDQGRVCVRMRGFSTREIEAEVTSDEAVETVMCRPVWKDEIAPKENRLTEYSQHLVLLIEMDPVFSQTIESRMKRVSCVSLQSKEKQLAERYQEISIQAFELIQKILRKKPKGNILIQILNPYGGQSLLNGLSGLLKTTRLENAKIVGQLIEISQRETKEGLLRKLQDNMQCPQDAQIRYDKNQRQVVSWEEIRDSRQAIRIPWKEKGTYLITGGTGGLGFIFAKEIARQTKEAVLILVGRTRLSPTRETQLKELERLGSRAVYLEVDVCRKKEVDTLIQSIKKDFGSLSGILHCAGVVRDNFILKKTIEEFKTVLASKVAGTVNLDEATRNHDLDFFVLFSSGSAVLGNLGQADYSTANAFMDAYAAYRDGVLLSDDRRGQTLSINWPLWKEGGMEVDEATKARMSQTTGMIPMQTSSGIEALRQGLACALPQILVMEGKGQTIRQKLLVKPHHISPEKGSVQRGEVTQKDDKSLLDKIEFVLTQTVSELIKLDVEHIDREAELGKYGFDSISFTDFANELNRKYRLDLTPTIFFEYSTLRKLAEYLNEEHQASLAKAFQVKPKADHVTEPENVGQEKIQPSKSHRNRIVPLKLPISESISFQGQMSSRSRWVNVDPIMWVNDSVLLTSKSEPKDQDAVAIIGMSGRFPMANDLDEFWENLKEGKTCISTIPKDRWDWEALYGDPHQDPNKTNIKWGGFIDGVSEFDPLFFDISPREAELMDPQQRLLMTYVWLAVEDAGYSSTSLAGSNTGIFVGTGSTGYSSLIASVAIEGYTSTGMVPSVGPNRMSYFMDWHGPSEPIETACSSSLIAIHRGILAIETGSCDMAVVGGVNTLISPEIQISFNKAGMLCKDGRCKTFSAQADGYVRGEGVGMLLLKRLKLAEDAGDHIYAVIRGSAENHGGRASSLTAPNPKAQSELLKAAYTKAGIDIRSVSYIDAHGTGTELGDPIEVNGLKMALKDLSNTMDESQILDAHCGLGSVKTNIGHLELTAGVAGVIKVLLQMKNKTLVKTLHCDEMNPYIQLQDTPFYIVQENKEWTPLQDRQGRSLPRRAGVSSFGFGGANAHIVIEEYIDQGSGFRVQGSGFRVQGSGLTNKDPYLIVLSAKSEERLKEVVKNLYTYLTSSLAPRPLPLHEVAYTLQVGRDAMEERLGVVVESSKELVEKLQGFIEDKDGVGGLFRGRVRRKKDSLALFETDEDLISALDAWIEKGKYEKLLDLWVNGMGFDWNKLYGEIKPRRISLPTYPFAREQYWINGISDFRFQISDLKNQLHPLLHENTSDLSEQRFSSTFTGEEFFLADHQVNGQKFLPGVAYLEIARAAVEQAAGSLMEENGGIQLKDVVWARPIVANGHEQSAHIGLHPEENGQIRYKIYTELTDGDERAIVHNQGVATFNVCDKLSPLDLPGLQASMNHGHLNPKHCYDAFKRMGIDYGSGHQGLESVYASRNQVLAKLSLPLSIRETQNDYILHPSLMDSALQATIGLKIRNPKSETPEAIAEAVPLSGVRNLSLPFSLETVEIIEKCTSLMWVRIGYSTGSAPGDKVQKLDIDLYDDRGTICVRMKGFSSRRFETTLESPHQRAEIASEVLMPSATREDEAFMVDLTMLSPVWNTVTPPTKNSLFPMKTTQVVVVGGTKERRNRVQEIYPHAQTVEIRSQDGIASIAARLKKQGYLEHIVWIAPDCAIKSLAQMELIEEQNQGVLQIFRIIKALLSLGYGTKDLGWTLITIQAQAVHKKESVNPAHASIHGLIGSLAKEFPNWKIRLLDMEKGYDWPIQEMFRLPVNVQGDALAYRGKEWFQQALIHVQQEVTERSAYRVKGVYVVIGGAGGIGEVWSRSMIEKYQAQVIWIGRRKKDATIQGKVEALSKLGPAPIYVQADASDRNSLQKAYNGIKNDYAQIHGVVHSAIVLLDQSLIKMEEEQFKASLQAKVDASVNLAKVFQGEPLDVVLFFSSLTAFAKAAGQSNYASGCTFKDAFAHQLAKEWSCAVKVMNWGYWGSVGIVKNRSYRERMEWAGIGSIEPREGMEALEILLQNSIDQLALIKTRSSVAVASVNFQPQINGESIRAYSEDVPSCIGNLEKNFSEHESSTRIKSSEMVAIKSMGQHRTVMEEMLLKLLGANLESLGLLNGLSDRTDRDRKPDVVLHKFYDRWLEESITILREKAYLRYDGKKGSAMESSHDLEALWNDWNRAKTDWLKDPNLNAQVNLVEACLRALPEILTGKQQATEIMFPNSSMELVEGAYRGNMVNDLFNEMLGNSVVAYIEERLSLDPSAQIRILEIGAGTGGTTAGLLSKLRQFQDHLQLYSYTDISQAFLIHAQENFASQIPCLATHIFNVGAPISGQDIQPGYYDLALATNVLHATKNIREALRNVKATLKKHGLIFLNEINCKSLFTHLTFGLLEGWWLYEDERLRIPGAPGLYPETWQEVLEEEGFTGVFFPAKTIHELGHQIIVAESDGIVRQKRLENDESTRIEERTSISSRENVAPLTSTKLPEAKSRHEIEEVHERPGDTVEILREKISSYVVQTLCDVVKLTPEKIQLETPIEKYGVDSILQVSLIQSLEEVTGELSKTILFEYSTIQELTEYLIKHRSDTLRESFGLNHHEDVEQISDSKSSEKIFAPSPKKNRFIGFSNSQLAAQSETENIGGVEDIAIIGISGRYPMSNNLEELWDHLKSGHDCITEADENRWEHSLIKTLSDKESPLFHKTYYGGFLETINRFDHRLFGIPCNQVLFMPPELRLLLEVSWETFEDAGYSKPALQELQARYRRGIGVFVGAMYNQYFWNIPSVKDAAVRSNATDWEIPNRISHFFNLTGPSLAINSACSSSLTAIHLACESLKQQSCSMALVGGVNLTLDPSKYEALQLGKLLGSGSQSRSFGDGDGMIPGEGVGAVLLKPLSRAIQDCDRIYAVIKSSFVNHSGGRQMYTAPDPTQQTQLIVDSIERSGIDPATINYVESAVNGSELGDPIEILALKNAFSKFTDQHHYCALGSVKSNLGHLEAASGMSQLSKVLLQLKHQTLVPSINTRPRNPHLKLEGSAFYIQEACSPWNPLRDFKTSQILPRRCMINSFGAGGAYANLIVEEYIEEADTKKMISPSSSDREFLLLFSAATERSLMNYADKIHGFLDQNATVNLGEFAWSLCKVNHGLENRIALVASSIGEVLEQLTLVRETEKTVTDFGIYFSADANPDETPMSSMIQNALKNKDLRQLAAYWTAGATIDFSSLYSELNTRWISLPKYAFDHQVKFDFDRPDKGAHSETESSEDLHYWDVIENVVGGRLSEDQFANVVLEQVFDQPGKGAHPELELPDESYYRDVIENVVGGKLTEDQFENMLLEQISDEANI